MHGLWFTHQHIQDAASDDAHVGSPKNWCSSSLSLNQIIIICVLNQHVIKSHYGIMLLFKEVIMTRLIQLKNVR